MRTDFTTDPLMVIECLRFGPTGLQPIMFQPMFVGCRPKGPPVEPLLGIEPAGLPPSPDAPVRL